MEQEKVHTQLICSEVGMSRMGMDGLAFLMGGKCCSHACSCKPVCAANWPLVPYKSPTQRSAAHRRSKDHASHRCMNHGGTETTYR